MKRIGIDCRFAALDSGLGRYTRELVSHLLQRNDPMEFMLFVRSDDESWLKNLRGSNFKTQVADIPHYSFSEQFSFPSIIKKSAIDLFFAPHFNVPLRLSIPFVVTIHDLILHRYPNQASAFKRLGYRLLLSHAVRRSKRIIAVSNFTAQEIVTVFGPKEREKIVTIYEAVSNVFFPRSGGDQELVKQKYKLFKPFFLYVGNAKEHKNVKTLIDAYLALRDESKELVLVTGGKEISKIRLPDGVRLLSGIPDNDLSALYSAAITTVTASLYEGFGLILPEAQACGCPLIAPRLGAFLELAGTGVTLVAPTKEDLADAMKHPSPHYEPVHQFSWEETAERTAKVFMEK